jgi:hypothetical protein
LTLLLRGQKSTVQKQKPQTEVCGFWFGAPGAIRTPDPQIRSLMLYPAELRAPNKKTIGFANEKPQTEACGF